MESQPEKSSVPIEVSKRRESVRLIYSPSIHWLGGITVLCILGIAVSPYLPGGASAIGPLATVAGITAGALAKLVSDNSNQPTQTSSPRE